MDIILRLLLSLLVSSITVNGVKPESEPPPLVLTDAGSITGSDFFLPSIPAPEHSHSGLISHKTVAEPPAHHGHDHGLLLPVAEPPIPVAEPRDKHAHIHETVLPNPHTHIHRPVLPVRDPHVHKPVLPNPHTHIHRPVLPVRDPHVHKPVLPVINPHGLSHGHNHGPGIPLNQRVISPILTPVRQPKPNILEAGISLVSNLLNDLFGGGKQRPIIRPGTVIRPVSPRRPSLRRRRPRPPRPLPPVPLPDGCENNIHECGRTGHHCVLEKPGTGHTTFRHCRFKKDVGCKCEPGCMKDHDFIHVGQRSLKRYGQFGCTTCSCKRSAKMEPTCTEDPRCVQRAIIERRRRQRRRRRLLRRQRRRRMRQRLRGTDPLGLDHLPSDLDHLPVDSLDTLDLGPVDLPHRDQPSSSRRRRRQRNPAQVVFK